MAEKGILDPRSEQGIFVGYDKYSPAYVVYYPGTERVQKHRLVKFTTKTANESARSLVESLRLWTKGESTENQKQTSSPAGV